MQSSVKIVAVALSLVAAPAAAQTIIEGLTFSVADSGDGVGTHFHSGGDGEFADRAEVGSFSVEEIRGLSEFSLPGLSAASSAILSFNVLSEHGIFTQPPFTGTITLLAYSGNNAEDLSDFQIAPIATIGSFAISPETADVGDVFSFDITTIYNDAVANGLTSLGVRLQPPSIPGDGAWQFDQFRLTSSQGAVPEPGSWAMMVLGFGAVGGAMRSRRVGERIVAVS